MVTISTSPTVSVRCAEIHGQRASKPHRAHLMPTRVWLAMAWWRVSGCDQTSQNSCPATAAFACHVTRPATWRKRERSSSVSAEPRMTADAATKPTTARRRPRSAKYGRKMSGKNLNQAA